MTRHAAKLFWGIFILYGLRSEVKAQFHHFEPTLAAGMLGKTGLDFHFSGQMNYCLHLSPVHGFGAHLAFNYISQYENYSFYYPQRYYDVYPKYGTFPFASYGLFYRVYIGDWIYVESIFSLGRWHETFKAQRVAVPNVSPPVTAVNIDSDLKYPIFKIEPNVGMQFEITDHLYFFYKTGMDLFFLRPPLQKYLVTRESPLTTAVFYPTKGVYFFMHFSVGIGFMK